MKLILIVTNRSCANVMENLQVKKEERKFAKIGQRPSAQRNISKMMGDNLLLTQSVNEFIQNCVCQKIV